MAERERTGMVDLVRSVPFLGDTMVTITKLVNPSGYAISDEHTNCRGTGETFIAALEDYALELDQWTRSVPEHELEDQDTLSWLYQIGDLGMKLALEDRIEIAE